MQKEWAYEEKHCIECNLTAMDTYIHANINGKSQKNQKPIETSHSRGLCRKTPFLLPCNSSIFKHSFTPLKYLTALLSTILEVEKVSTIVNPS
jgi:hypothetical protein